MVYTSKQNVLIKEIASLKEKKGRNELGLFVAEGLKLVKDAILYNQEIVKIVVAENFLGEIPKVNAEVITVSNEVFKFISSEVTPQGILAVIKIPNQTVKAPKDNSLILDGVQDPGNLGAIIRSANAFNYKELYLVNSVDAYSPKVVRSSMSGIYNVKIYKCNYNELFEVLNGVKVIVADMGGEDITNFVAPEKFSIVMGNEGNGVSETMRKRADYTVKIPMNATCESLNVAVASSIMMYKLNEK